MTITHEDPGEADHGEPSAEHEEHEEGGQHPGHHHVVQVVACNQGKVSWRLSQVSGCTRVSEHDQAAQRRHHQGDNAAGCQVDRSPTKPDYTSS